MGLPKGTRSRVRRARRILSKFLPPLVLYAPTAVAAVAAVFLLAAGPNLLGRLIGLALATGCWLVEAAVLFRPNSKVARRTGPALIAGTLLTVGFGALYLSRDAGPAPMVSAPPVWAGCAAVVIALWLAGAQPHLLGTRPLLVANLTAATGRVSAPGMHPLWALRMLWVVIAVTGLLAMVSAPAWALGMLVLLAVLVSFLTTMIAWRFADRARYRALREIKALRPKFVVPYDGTLTYQVEMWEEHFRQLAVPYLIVTLKPATLAPLAAMTSAPVIVASVATAAAVNTIIPASVRVAFYPHNSARNAIFLANKDIQSVFVHHGDGDKPPSYAAKSARYDHLFVAGQAAIDRYANHGVTIPAEKFHIIGRPQADSIRVDRRPIAEKPNPVILYAPTWHGKRPSENYSSLPMGLPIVNALISRGARVVFRPHPASENSAVHRRLIRAIQQALMDDHQRTGRAHVWGNQAETGWTVADVANICDAMVSDASGIVTDFIQTAKPYAMVSTRMSAAEFKRSVPTSVEAYVIDSDPATLVTAVDDLLSADPLAEIRWQQRSYYLGGFSGDGATRAFLAESWKLLGVAHTAGIQLGQIHRESRGMPVQKTDTAAGDDQRRHALASQFWYGSATDLVD